LGKKVHAAKLATIRKLLRPVLAPVEIATRMGRNARNPIIRRDAPSFVGVDN
jgi:hypothetical protein